MVPRGSKKLFNGTAVQRHQSLANPRKPAESVGQHELSHASNDSLNPAVRLSCNRRRVSSAQTPLARHEAPTGLNSSERLAKRQVSNDVQGEQVEPASEVNAFLGRSQLSDSGDEGVHVPADDGFLLSQGPLGKSAGEVLPHHRVLCGVALARDGLRHVGEHVSIVEGGLDERAVSFALAIDVFPGLCRVEGQLVGRNADDGACGER